ncbi:MAG TPA: TRAP transporter large permease [Syntrophorhabdaceae bacterium]|nr:TRAP transporter large permease [Syntrophorhabdaceae bacterium]
MSPEVIGLLAFVVLFALLAMGMQIGVAMGFIGFIGMCILYPIPGAIVKIAVTPFEIASNYNFAVMPLFIFMAQITLVCGFGADLYRVAAKWLGHHRGGLAIASIGAATGFAACSGSSLATAATVTVVALPEMKKYNYDMGLASGALAAGGTIGSLIPPAGTLIVYAILTGVSIGQLFAASLIPAALTVLAYVLVVHVLCRMKPKLGPPIPKVPLMERIASLKDCWELLLLLIFVIGGMIIGWFTPTEAAAIGAAGATLLAAARRRLTWEAFVRAAKDTMTTSGMIYVILIGAIVFNGFCAKTLIPMAAADWIAGLKVAPWLVIMAMMLIYFLMGMVMEAPSIQILTLPVFYPIVVNALGYHPVWFGVVQVRMLEITSITPPLGMVAYVIAGIDKDLTLYTVFRGVMPFLLMEIVTLPLFLFVMPITMWLPSLLR